MLHTAVVFRMQTFNFARVYSYKIQKSDCHVTRQFDWNTFLQMDSKDKELIQISEYMGKSLNTTEVLGKEATKYKKVTLQTGNRKILFQTHHIPDIVCRPVDHPVYATDEL